MLEWVNRLWRLFNKNKGCYMHNKRGALMLDTIKSMKKGKKPFKLHQCNKYHTLVDDNGMVMAKVCLTCPALSYIREQVS